MKKEDHRKLGIDYFNKTWDYIDKVDKTNDEILEMIHYSHASRLHWTLADGEPLNIVRGEWQIAFVYSLVGMGESCLTHATYCLEKTIENNIGDFDLVFAYQVMALGNKLTGNLEDMGVYLKKGYEALEHVAKDGDKKYCKSELDKVKG